MQRGTTNIEQLNLSNSNLLKRNNHVTECEASADYRVAADTKNGKNFLNETHEQWRGTCRVLTQRGFGSRSKSSGLEHLSASERVKEVLNIQYARLKEWRVESNSAI